MQLKEFLVRLAVVGAMLTSAALSYGQSWNFPAFSATQVFESRKANLSMKVYLSGSSVRIDRSPAISTLYVPSQSRVYNLTTYPDQSHQCVSMTAEQARMLPSPLGLLEGTDVKRNPVGTEMMEGHPCRVEDVIVTRPDGKKIQSKVWEAQDLQGIPVKIESHLGEITLSAVYSDISVSAPDRGLFAVPEKCTPFENMGQVAEQKTLQ